MIKIIDQFCNEPDKLRKKPESVNRIENATKTTACLKSHIFGNWQVYVKDVSMFCNPFGITYGYTRSANEWDIWFVSKDNNPREYQTTDQILVGLQQYGYLEES